MTRLRLLWRRRPLVLVAFVLATLAAAVFLGRAVVATVYWSAHHEVPVAGWMTPSYIEHSWQLPKYALRAPLGLTPPVKGEHPLTVAEMARTRGVSEAEMVAQVQKLVDAAAAARAKKAPLP